MSYPVLVAEQEARHPLSLPATNMLHPPAPTSKRPQNQHPPPKHESAITTVNQTDHRHHNTTTPQHRYASAQAGTSSCTVNCAPGYSGSGGTVTCDASTQDQDASFDNVQCTENECTLPDLEAVNLVLSSSCSTPLTTTTNSECTTECASRYYSTSASSTLT